MRTLIPLLAVTLGLTVTAPVVAQPADQGGAAGSAVTTQDLRAPDRLAPATAIATQDLRTPDRIADGSAGATETTEVAVAPQAVSTPDGGLSTALIVLLAVGGAVVLAAGAVVGTRYAQAHGHRGHVTR
jgi:hypothetical protein